MLKHEMFFPSAEQEKFIRDNCVGISNRELTKLFNEVFKTSYSIEQIKRFKTTRKLNSGLNGQFKKGHVSWNKGTKGLTGPNKTSFKKGVRPPQQKPVGTVVKTRDGYLVEKIAEPNEWKYKHRMVWEEHNGPIQDDQCIIFMDCNTENLDIKNLAMISRRQLALMNKYNLKSEDADLTRSAILLTELMVKVIDRRSENK